LGCDTVCQSSFTDPVFVASLFTAHFCWLRKKWIPVVRVTTRWMNHIILNGELATLSSGVPRPRTLRRSAHLHPPTRPDPHFERPPKSLIKKQTSAEISAAASSTASIKPFAAPTTCLGPLFQTSPDAANHNTTSSPEDFAGPPVFTAAKIHHR